jgi:hypothetical protein
MRWTSRRSIVLAALLAVLVAGVPAVAAPKNLITATVNGKRVKLKRNVTFTVGGTTVAFLAIGQTRPRGGLLRTLGFGCGDAPTPNAPTTLMFCTVNYQETRLRHPSTKFWAIPSADQPVTITSYDGTQISGSFDLEVPPVNTDAPIHIQATFRGRVVSAN